jgi:drug/metabolite transporter (DMT)-like permease
MTKTANATTYRQKVGAFCGLVGAILWLSPDSLLVRLYACDAPTQLFYKNLFFSAAMAPVLLLVQGGARNALFSMKITGKYLAVQSLLFTVTQFAFTLSVTNTAAATTLALLASSPLFAAFFSRWILGERLTAPTLMAMLGGLVGVGIVFVGNLIAAAGEVEEEELEQVFARTPNATNATNATNASLSFSIAPAAGGGGDNDALGIVLGLVCAISLGLYLTIVRYVAETRPGASELAPLLFVGPICGIIGACMGAYVLVEPMDLLWAFLQGSIVGSVAFGTIAVCPRYLLSSEVGLVQLLETVLGPFWVWLAGYESPPVLTLYGGFVLLLTLGCYFSYTMYQDKVQAAEAAEAAEAAAALEGGGGGGGGGGAQKAHDNTSIPSDVELVEKKKLHDGKVEEAIVVVL